MVTVPNSGYSDEAPCDIKSNLQSALAELSFQPSIRIIQSPLGELDGKLLRSLKRSDTSVPYVIDMDGNFYSAPGLNVTDLGEKLVGLEDDSQRILVREAGTLTRDKETSTLTFTPSYRIDSTLPENKVAFEHLKKKPGWENISYAEAEAEAAAGDESAVLSCMDLLNKQAKGKGFITSKLVGSFGITAVGLIATEPMAHRFDTPAGRTVAETDLANSLVSSALFSYFGRELVKRGIGDNKATIARFSVSGAMILVQNQIYSKSMQKLANQSPEEAQHKANQISTYDTGYTFFRSWMSQKIDKHFLETLPYTFYDQCRKYPNRKAMLVLAPGMIRLVESGAATMIYFGGRSALTGQ
jgi:hypothetical protein